MAETQWKGTDQERDELTRALHRNCLCQYDRNGLRSKTCPGHEALLLDQRFLDGVLEMRHFSDKLREQEGIEPHDQY